MTESRTKGGPARLDPFEFWREIYEANEQAWTKAMKDVMTSPGYAEAQGKMLESFLSFQKIMRDGMTAQLSSLNLPTRDDVARLGELLVGLEEKIDRLDERLTGLESHLSGQEQEGEQDGQAPGGGKTVPARSRRATASRSRSARKGEGRTSSEEAG